MKSPSDMPVMLDEQSKLSIFYPHPDPPWMDFSRSSAQDELQSLLILDLQSLQRPHNEPSENDYLLEVISTIKPLENVIPTLLSNSQSNALMYWSTIIPYPEPSNTPNLTTNNLYFTLEFYSNSYSSPNKLSKYYEKEPPMNLANSTTFKTQKHIIQQIFAVNTFFCLSLHEQKENRLTNIIPVSNEFASQVISSVSCALHEVGYDIPCFMPLDKKENSYMGVYYRVPSMANSEIPDPFLVQYFSYVPTLQEFPSLKDFKCFATHQFHNSLLNPGEPYQINQFLSWVYGSTTLPFEIFDWPETHPITILKNQINLIENFEIAELNSKHFYTFPTSLFTISISQESTTFPDEKVRALQLSCTFKPWISQPSQLFENLLNLRFQKDFTYDAKLHSVISLLNKRSYEHQLVKEIFKKKGNQFDELVKNQAEVITNELIYAREGLYGAPFGSLLSKLAFVSSTLPEKSFPKFWEKCIIKIKRRWNRQEIIPHVNGQPDGPHGQVLLMTCLLHQQLAVLNSCTVNKSINKIRFLGNIAQAERQKSQKSTKNSKGGKPIENYKITEPLLYPYPPFSSLTYKLWENRVFKMGQDHFPLLQLISEYQKENPQSDYDTFTKWLQFHFHGDPLFFKDHRKILSKKNDEESLNKHSHDVKAVWEMSKKDLKSTNPPKILQWETPQYSSPAVNYVFRSSLSTILEQFITIFVKNIMEMWGYNRMRHPHILVDPALQKFLFLLQTSTTELVRSNSNDSMLLKKSAYSEKSALLDAFRVLEKSLLITYFLESTFTNSNILERLLTQFTYSIFNQKHIILQPVEVCCKFTSKDEITHITNIFGISPDTQENSCIPYVGCFHHLSSSIDILLKETITEPSKNIIPTSRLHAEIRSNDQSVISYSLVSKDLLQTNFEYF